MSEPARKVLVVTGAGISLASGIPTFRGSDPGAIWANDTMEKATLAFFHRNPVESWKWYWDRFMAHAEAQPNASHLALAEWERKEEHFLLVTQNVDTLHEKAGSAKLVKVHGSLDRARCARGGCLNGAPHGTIQVWKNPNGPSGHLGFETWEKLQRFRENPRFETLPRCSKCRALIRPHVLWFDETYAGHADYDIDRIREFAMDATHVVFVGTSFQVGVTAMVMDAACGRPWAEVKVVDPNPIPVPFTLNVTQVWERAEEWLPKHVAGLENLQQLRV